MDEPTGHTIDGTPWEEPRGPHLPDRLTTLAARLPRASWAFIVLAIANGTVLAIDQGLLILRSPATDWAITIRAIVGLIVQVVPPVATMLFGAALFARHPRAWSTHRYVAMGVVLLAVVEAMQTASIWLRGIFAILTPPPDDLISVAPSDVAFTVLTTILLAIGTIYVARGLRAARLQADGQGASRRTLAIAVVTVLLAGSSAVLTFLAVSRSSDLEGLYLAYVATMTVVGWLPLVALAFLAVSVSAGMAAGERPVAAWRLAAAGVWSILLAYAIVAVASMAAYVLTTPETDFAAWSWIYLVSSGISGSGYLLLLAAFVRGLPSAAEADTGSTG